MKLNYRIVIFSLAIVFGIAFSIPSLLNTSGKKITLGLDLQGGLHMRLGIKTDEAVQSKIKSITASIKHFSEKNDILIDNLKFNKNSLTFEILDIDDKSKIDKYIKNIDGLNVEFKDNFYTITLTQKEIEKTKQQAIDQAVETIRNRLDQFGLSEPLVAKQGDGSILVEIAGIKSSKEEKRARELISRAAKLELMAVDEERDARVYSMSDEEAASYGDVILSDVKDENKKYLLKEIPIIEGEMLTDARVGFDQNNRPVINFTLNSEGAEIFADFTEKNVGKRLAIVLDGKVYSDPKINERIGGGSGQISGNYSVVEAKDLAIALRSGSLMAPIVMLEKRSVGPSLGADSIKASLIALISGFLLVMVFMVVYYRMGGVIANLALVVNLFLILAIMALFGATLTLPGMAGIVLTVGMAVDANVIILERIRELLKEGVSIKKALEDGYKNAMSAILDANITTLLASIILYAYGTGAIKGFAITMSIGILASMLTAILGTHGIYESIIDKIDRSKNTLLWFGIKA